MSENWQPHPEYIGLYEVSTYGRVRGVERRCRTRNGTRRVPAKMLAQSTITGGYIAVCLTKNGRCKTRTVHQLVLETFVGPRPDGQETCHEDGVRNNNLLTNLRWDTKVSNMADKVKHGTHNRGERSGNTVLTDKQVCDIITTLATGETTSHAASMHGVPVKIVWRIRNNEAWTHLPRPTMPTRRHGKSALSAAAEAELDRRLLTGESGMMLATQYGVSTTTVYRRRRALGLGR